MFYQIFLSQKVKRCANITYKRGRYEFPHKLSNDLTLRILQNSIIRKVSKLLSAHSSYQNLNFVNTSKKLLKNRELPIVPYFTWKLELVSNVLWMKFWPTLVNTDFNETLSYQFSFGVNKCGGSCNANYDPYSQVCVPDKVKNECKSA